MHALRAFASVRLKRASLRVLAAAAMAALGGCATAPGHPDDPLEPWNRQVHEFNDHMDAWVLRPVAATYQRTVPLVVRTGVTNFFGNLSDVWSLANHVLQLQMRPAAEMLARVQLNTMFGLGGLIDIASDLDLTPPSTDFGLTLGRYGVPTGPYIVLPLLGPSSLRDASAAVVESQYQLIRQIDPVSQRNLLHGLQVVNTRAGLLGLDGLLEGAALDKYSFVRDGYLQRRRNVSELE